MRTFMKSLVGAAASMLLAIGGANAASVNGSLFAGVNQLSDNSAEALIDMGGSAVGIVDVGDRLRGIFTIETVEPLGGGATRQLGAGSGNSELTGLFDVTVVAKFASPNPVTGITSYTFAFAPTATFATEIANLTGKAVSTGTAIAFFDDSTPDYSRLNPSCTTTGPGGDCEALVTNGDLIWTTGTKLGGANSFWFASTNTDNISVIGNASSVTNGGTFNIGLYLLDNYTTREFKAVQCGVPTSVVTDLEFCGSGSLLGRSGAATPYDSWDNVDFSINVVPEPTSVALVGLGLLAAGAASRRRKIAQK